MATTSEFTSIQNLSDLQFTQNSRRKASHRAFYKAVDPNASKIKWLKKKKKVKRGTEQLWLNETQQQNEVC